jgi:predicted choloylglycine hydrolase
MYHPRLKGNHYDMGFHYGEILYKSGLNFDESIKLTEEQLCFGREAFPVYEKYAPQIMQEVKGLAEGSKTPYTKMASWLMTMYGFGDVHGCTCFAFHDNNTTILCRNSDMFPELKKTSESVLYRPDDGYMFLGNSTSFIQMEDGMNEHGLAIGINFLMTKTYKIGLNTGFVVRLVLETCKTTEEAIALIKLLPLCSTQNFLIGDKSGHLVVLEASPNKVILRESRDYLVSANHFISEKMRGEHANPEENWYLSYDRFQTADTALKENEKDLSFAMELAGGKKGFICQYKKNLNFDTLWSSVYDISNLKVYRAEGNPGKTKYKEDTRLTWGFSKR